MTSRVHYGALDEPDRGRPARFTSPEVACQGGRDARGPAKTQVFRQGAYGTTRREPRRCVATGEVITWTNLTPPVRTKYRSVPGH